MSKLTDLDPQELVRLLEFVDRSGISLFRLRTPDTEILISTGSASDSLANEQKESPQSVPATTPSATSQDAAPPQGATGETKETALLPAGVEPVCDDYTKVLAPLMGTFYRAPSPGAQPFVEVDSVVEPDTTVGLIETMKVFTAVSAGLHGTVRAVIASNGELVGFGQPLVSIEPTA